MRLQNQSDRWIRRARSAWSERGVTRKTWSEAVRLYLAFARSAGLPDTVAGLSSPHVKDNAMSSSALFQRGPAIVSLHRDECNSYCKIEPLARQANLFKTAAQPSRQIVGLSRLVDISMNGADPIAFTFGFLSDANSSVVHRSGHVYVLSAKEQRVPSTNDENLPTIDVDGRLRWSISANVAAANENIAPLHCRGRPQQAPRTEDHTCRHYKMLRLF